jgi:phosphoesterase RecJ-like protein
MRIDLQKTAEWLKSHDNYLIVTHRRPDGDTVGCAGALCLGLRAMGKRAVVLENPQFTPLYTPYLYDTIGPVPAQPTIVSVDLATESLLPLVDLPLEGKVQLAIDHHESYEDFAPLALMDSHAAACGEIIYALLRQMRTPISLEMGTALYVAISTDTGCFKYSNTSANTLRTAADLKELGVDLYRINKILFATKTLGRLRLEARLTESLEFYANGLVGLCTLPKALMEELGITEDDADGVAGFARGVLGVQIGVMIREVEHGAGKVSLRTGDDYNASEICKRLGGGGHRAAAGATVEGGIAAAKAAVLQAIADSGVVL